MRQIALIPGLVVRVGILAIGAGTMWCAAAKAEGDISLMLSGNQVITTKVSEEGVPLGPERVFSGKLSLVSGTWYTDEPGIQIEPGTLGVGSNLGMYFTRALRQWSGSNFDLVSDGRLSATYGPSSNSIITPPVDGNTANLLFPVGSSGGLHDHPDWVLENFNPGSDPVYFLFEAQLSSSQFGVLDSDPFYVVLSVNADESELEAMEAWVRRNVVPAPASLLFLGLFGLACVRRQGTCRAD